MLRVAELFPGVHGECARALAESDALGAVLAAVARLAEQVALVLRAGRRVQHFVAHGCETNRNQSVQLRANIL